MPFKILLVLCEALDIQIKWCICTQEISKISNTMKTSALAAAIKEISNANHWMILNYCGTDFRLKTWRKCNCIANTILKFTGNSDPG